MNSSKEFNRVYNKPTNSWHTKEFVLFYKKDKSKKVAFIASKKVGNAIKRNRAKRLLKAHFIQESQKLESGIYIFVAKPPILESNFIKTSKTLHYIYKKLNLYSNVNN